MKSTLLLAAACLAALPTQAAAPFQPEELQLRVAVSPAVDAFLRRSFLKPTIQLAWWRPSAAPIAQPTCWPPAAPRLPVSRVIISTGAIHKMPPFLTPRRWRVLIG